MKNKHLVYLCVSSFIAQVGGYFTFVAMPWLALSMTDNSAWHTSLMVAAWSIPHGLLIFGGGVLADRYSPRRTLLVARTALFVALLSLALILYLDYASIWLLYGFAFLFGSFSAISLPASQALLPSIVDSNDLEKSNAYVIGLNYVAQIIGPALAGWCIWAARDFLANTGSFIEYALALSIDAVLLSVAIFFTLKISVSIKAQPASGSFVRSLFEGFKYVWFDRNFKIVLSYIALVSLCLHGPILTILPILTKVKLSMSEVEFGLLYSALGVGVVTGAGLSFTRQVSAAQLGMVVLILDLISGFSLLSLSYSKSLPTIAACLLVMGFCSGYVMVVGTAWFQRKCAPEYMGRVMSILMFSVSGLTPISALICGVLIERYDIASIIALFAILIVCISAMGLCIPGIRNMGAYRDIDNVSENQSLENKTLKNKLS